MKQVLLCIGVVWSGGLLTAQVFKAIDLGSNRDFFLGVFAGCTTGLGLSKKPESENQPLSGLDPLEKDKNGFY